MAIPFTKHPACVHAAIHTRVYISCAYIRPYTNNASIQERIAPVVPYGNGIYVGEWRAFERMVPIRLIGRPVFTFLRASLPLEAACTIVGRFGRECGADTTSVHNRVKPLLSLCYISLRWCGDHFDVQPEYSSCALFDSWLGTLNCSTFGPRRRVSPAFLCRNLLIIDWHCLTKKK